MKDKNTHSLSILKKASNSDKLVVFAGAGVSADSGMPLWAELIEKIKGTLNDNLDIEKDYLKIGQILYNEKGEKEYYDIIKNSLLPKVYKSNRLHELIFELNPQHIITTNYDCLFEEVITNKGLPFSIVSKDIDLPYAIHKNLLIKYHGDFENKNIVFKENDYLEFSKNNTLKEIFVKALFSNNVVLFVGYGVGDINLKLLINDLQYILKKHHQRAFLLLNRKEISNSELSYYENLGITVINYTSEDKQDEKPLNLSVKGKVLYQQLKDIKNFEVYNYNQITKQKDENEIIIEKVFYSFQRFKYFKTLPTSFISSVYPFNKNSNRIKFLSEDNIFCPDKEFYEILREYDREDGKKYTLEAKNQLNSIFSTLMHACIFKLSYNGLSYQRAKNGSVTLSDKYDDSETKCNCLSCLSSRFRYQDIFIKHNDYFISDDSDIYEDLQFAFSLFKSFEYFKSFTAYKTIQIKANRQNLMDVSFICKLNIAKIADRGISYYQKAFNNIDELENIENERLLTNLDQDLDRIKNFVDHDLFRLLKIFKEENYVHATYNKIDSLFFKIQANTKKIEKGGAVISGDFATLYNEVIRLESFFQKNLIILNEDINFIVNKFIKSFFLGVYLNKTQERIDNNFFRSTTIDTVNKEVVRLIIKYGNSSELVDYFNEYKLQKVKINSDSTSDVIKYVNNFLDCFYTDENEDYYKEKQVTSNYLNYLRINNEFLFQLKNQAQNICFILGHFEFEYEVLNKFYKKISSCLKFFSFDRDSFKAFNTLLKNRYKEIDICLLKDTLNYLLEEKIFDNTFYILLYRINEIDSEFRVEKIDLGYLFADDVSFNHIALYNKTFEKNLHKQFVKFLDDKLKIEMDFYLVYQMLFAGIKISTKNMLKFNKIGIQNLLNFNKDNFNDNDISDIICYIHLLHKGFVSRNNLSKIKVTNNFVTFLLDPLSFDYSMFQTNWLKLKSFNLNDLLKVVAKSDDFYNLICTYLKKEENPNKSIVDIFIKVSNYRISQKE